VLFSCQSDIGLDEGSDAVDISYTTTEIDDFITSFTDKGEIFDWKEASNSMIYSALVASDSIMAVGYAQQRDADLSEIIGIQDQLSEELISVREEIINTVLQNEQLVRNRPDLKREDILPFGVDDEIPTLALHVSAKSSVELIAQGKYTRYHEPMGYEMQSKEIVLKSSSGCSGSPDYGINGQDYSNTQSYNAKIPWNFNNHNVQAAWSRSSGDNIGICIIDTGLADSQDNLGSNFNSGNSTGRTVQKYSTHYTGRWWWRKKESPNDRCGHGTSMAGLAGAPWSTDGNALGVAYRSNIIGIRAVEDVLISSSNEKNGVKDALRLAGNRSDIKIVSMSIGNIISSGTVRDGIYYAYNRGKLLLAAAGTSTSFTNWAGVIFPANMSQTTAVTGVKAQSSYQRCNPCHSGSKVDFTIQMQRSFDSDRNSLALATSSNQPKYISGSSAATATTAGIAALVWATNPGMSRSQVITRLKNASQNGNNRTSSYGWGNIDAEKAVRGLSY